jgi:hypothetical protein
MSKQDFINPDIDISDGENKYDTWDMWEFFRVPYASYNSSIDEKFIRIIENNILDKDNSYSTVAAKKLDIDPDFVEFIYYVLCGTELWEYGTSPRGCWAIDEEKCKELLNKCKKYFFIHWIKEEDL